QQKIRDIGARNQKHETHRRKQYKQRSTQTANKTIFESLRKDSELRRVRVAAELLLIARVDGVQFCLSVLQSFAWPQSRDHIEVARSAANLRGSQQNHL